MATASENGTYQLAIRAAEVRAMKFCKTPADFEREATFAAYIVTNADRDDLPNLVRANPSQLTEAVVQACASGVSLNPALGLAYLVPRAGKIRLEFGYQGYIQLATASGSISDVFVETVHKGDVFKRGVKESRPYIDHEPGDGPRTPETMTGVYCLTTLPNGNVIPCYMTRADVDSIKTQAPPWKQRYLEMAKKTVIRRARKTWPKQIAALERAVAVDEFNEDTPNPLAEGAIETQAENVNQTTGEIEAEYVPPETISNEQAAAISRDCMSAGIKISQITDLFHVEALQQIPADRYEQIMRSIAKRVEANAKPLDREEGELPPC